MSYVYIESEHHAEGSLYTVGFYDPKGKWQPESDHDNRQDAADRVAYLNGSGTKTCEAKICGVNCGFNCGYRRNISEALNSGDGVYRP